MTAPAPPSSTSSSTPLSIAATDDGASAAAPAMPSADAALSTSLRLSATSPSTRLSIPLSPVTSSSSSPSLPHLVSPSSSSPSSSSPSSVRPRATSDVPPLAFLVPSTPVRSPPSLFSSSVSPTSASSPHSSSPASTPSAASGLAGFISVRDGVALATHISVNYRAYVRQRQRFIACFCSVSLLCLCASLYCAYYRWWWGEMDHWSLSVFGLTLLWLLSSIASGLFSQRLRAPSLYSRDLNRWLRLYALEWKWKEGQLRCLSAQQLARRRGRREKEQLREAEKERLQMQRRVEEEAERDRLAFLEQLEREEDSERDGGGGAGSGIQVRVVQRKRSYTGPLSVDGLLPITETVVTAEDDTRALTSAADYPKQDMRRRRPDGASASEE